ncbi:MAG: hypothetical protein KAJ31_06575 [Deltaproteobacteria bacterium]|nr:hypothetical protein [Deltaproteobacteria bacterium]
MNKLLLAAAVALFMINSFAISGSSGGSEGASIAEATLKGKQAQEILNELNCRKHEPGDTIKDETDGTMHTCPQPGK